MRAAETRFDRQLVLVVNRISQTPLVYFPPGTYRVGGTITLTRQLMLRGEGMTTSIVASTADAPVFLLKMGALRLYVAPTIRDLGVVGSYAGRPDLFRRQTGILLLHDPASTDATAAIEHCAIVGCGGHGFQSDTRGNTIRLQRCLIQANQLDGIQLGGAYSTNCRILDNVVRENRRGLAFEPEPGARGSAAWWPTICLSATTKRVRAGSANAPAPVRPSRCGAAARFKSSRIISSAISTTCTPPTAARLSLFAGTCSTAPRSSPAATPASGVPPAARATSISKVSATGSSPSPTTCSRPRRVPKVNPPP